MPKVLPCLSHLSFLLNPRQSFSTVTYNPIVHYAVMLMESALHPVCVCVCGDQKANQNCHQLGFLAIYGSSRTHVKYAAGKRREGAVQPGKEQVGSWHKSQLAGSTPFHPCPPMPGNGHSTTTTNLLELVQTHRAVNVLHWQLRMAKL